MKQALLVLTLMLLAGCGQQYSAPRNLDDACLLAAERPQYLRAMLRAEQNWGVPVAVQMATIYQESRFVGNARTPHEFALGIIPMGRVSSAYGYSQALDGTWEEYQSETGNRRANRTDIDDATDFIGWYMTLTRERNGIALTDARNQYLAYHEGHAGFARGSHNSKSWLLRVADNVADRAALYNAQLLTCTH
ncbi:lytic transglycosylase [Rhodobacterales bacterium HKCCE2091]|nr:lytic transglycosylase [Rhodobacterales bacterium HKCCE2091]